MYMDYLILKDCICPFLLLFVAVAVKAVTIGLIFKPLIKGAIAL